MKRKAAIFQGPGQPFQVREYPTVQPGPGLAGLALLSSGICGTDVHIAAGKLAMPDFPLIIGHEFIGRIDMLGAGPAVDALGRPLAVGDRVIASVAVPCGNCFNCRKGETASCLAFGVTYAQPASDPPHFHGGFAEYLYSPLTNLVKLPEQVDTFAAAAFPCGGPTVIRACEYGGGLEADELIAIQGNGSLGLFALAWAKAHRCRTALIGSAANPARLALTEALAPDRFFDYRQSTNDDIRQALLAEARRLDRGDGADVVIETSGAPDAFTFGLSLLRTRGRYFVPGQYSNRGAVAIEPQQITFRALRIIGSGQYTIADIGRYLEFLAAHPELQKLFSRLVTRYPVAQVNQAMADAEAGRAIKAVFVPEE
ncbi:alcohol dehydrogenase catalytic domain-containing protein [Victivallis sp. Marseille-Q1083]|uniref:alcohol dehydrogenase catalytic domain-containing protein n=1 Tax=Victivallis sp. Marseille-Q1083 TaxID=2717288 RepID=UPI00158ED567|nr:alcohol dehydrogenase catalytic domain-containing protein [Victivallis sp. Marseille-Q1083]